MQDAGIDRRLGPFELGEVLGRGAFGEVFDAVRRDDGRRFALKLLHDAGAAAVRELKHEARTLWNLPIPGLVTPSELGSWEGRWYVALPRVRGEPLDVAAAAWPRDDGDAREQWIAQVVVALSSTVAALHDAGVLHLDLKPSNVLVGADAEVTLLDFGFSRWVTRPPAGALAATAGERGTLHYSAPELLAGERATAAADCYAIGAMLHELLVGEPPRSAWSPSPSLRRRAGPLHRMCAALLSADPRERPSARALCESLRGTVPIVRRRAPALCGRSRELDAVAAAIDGLDGPRLVALCGPPGVGKTRFMDRVHDDAAARGVEVLRGRCYEHERTQFKGLEELLEGVERPPLPATEGDDDDTLASRRERRDQALAQAVLERLAPGTLVLIDDLQWIDADGSALLVALLTAASRQAFAVVTAARDDAAVDALGAELFARAGTDVPVHRLPLAPLDREALRELVRSCSDGLADAAVEAIAEVAAGSPFVAELLAATGDLAADAWRHGGSADEAIARVLSKNLAALPSADRRAIEIAAVAGAPMTEVALCLACRRQHPEDPALARLRAGGWLQTTAHASARVQVFHELIRTHVLQALDEPARELARSSLLDALVHTAAPPHEQFPHALALGRRAQAEQLARAAAADAEAALAFDAAGAWYRRARELADDAAGPLAELVRREALAWYAAGRPAEAAQAHLKHADTLDGEPRDGALLRAADAMMVAGDIDDGRDTLHPLLRRFGLPGRRSTLRAGLSLLRRVLWLRAPSSPTLRAWTPRHSERAATAWTLARGLAYTAPIESLDYALRALSTAIRDRDPRMTATLLAFIGGGVLHHLGPLRTRGERYLAQASELARHLGDADLAAHAMLWRGIKLVDLGQWTDAVTELEAALAALLPGRENHWERVTAEQSRLWVSWKRGDFVQLHPQAQALARAAGVRGDRLGLTVYSQFVAFADLARGTPATARATAAWLRDHWTQGGFTVQSFWAAILEAMAQLWRDDLDAATAAWRGVQRDFSRSGGNRAPIVAIENLEMHARLLLLAGVDAHREQLTRIAVRLRAFARPHAIAIAMWIEAVLAGAGEAAVLGAASALDGALLHAAAAALRVQLDDGASASAALIARGVTQPLAYAQRFYPLGRTPR
ncbi:MAG: AAA family ATPase [Deltaproteobacteria bacterium]|nr:AAA family ATPase [Deltaproteobacteria bacterium]